MEMQRLGASSAEMMAEMERSVEDSRAGIPRDRSESQKQERSAVTQPSGACHRGAWHFGLPWHSVAG